MKNCRSSLLGPLPHGSLAAIIAIDQTVTGLHPGSEVAMNSTVSLPQLGISRDTGTHLNGTKNSMGMGKRRVNKTSGMVKRRRNTVLANQDILKQIKLRACRRELILFLIKKAYHDGVIYQCSSVRFQGLEVFALWIFCAAGLASAF